MPSAEFIGMIGAACIMGAFIPQIIHLVKNRCSAAISIPTWFLLLFGNVFVLFHALERGDKVFTIMSIANILFTLVTLYLVLRYHNRACPVPEQHKGGEK